MKNYKIGHILSSGGTHFFIKIEKEDQRRVLSQVTSWCWRVGSCKAHTGIIRAFDIDNNPLYLVEIILDKEPREKNMTEKRMSRMDKVIKEYKKASSYFYKKNTKRKKELKGEIK